MARADALPADFDSLTAGVSSPPQVALTSPFHGASVQYLTNITIRANAADDTRVRRVRLLVDGEPICNKKFKAPDISLACGYNVRSMVGSYLTLTAEATDADGNRTVSPAVRVTVVR